MKRICFYHAGCPDGFGAAWAVRGAWGDSARYVARGHDDRAALGECENASIAFVDIAPGPEELEQIAECSAQTIVLDHHVTNHERLTADPDFMDALESEGHLLHFDLEHSGAVLAWQHFRPDEPVPDLLRYVEDQDLWNWALPDSDAVNAAITSYPREFEIWDRLAQGSIEALVQEGRPILRANRMEVRRRLEHAHPIVLGTQRIEAVNASSNRSQIGHELAQRATFGPAWGLVYRVEGRHVFATLYSIGEVDVSAVAVELGGGGHRNAAGFQVSLDRWAREFLL